MISPLVQPTRSPLLLIALCLLLSSCLFSTHPLSPRADSKEDQLFIGQWHVKGEEDDTIKIFRGERGLIARSKGGYAEIHFTPSNKNLYANMIENPDDHWLILKVIQPREGEFCFVLASQEKITSAINSGQIKGAIDGDGFGIFKWQTPVVSDTPERLIDYFDNSPELFSGDHICYLKKAD